jgi:hypothetical protein
LSFGFIGAQDVAMKRMRLLAVMPLLGVVLLSAGCATAPGGGATVFNGSSSLTPPALDAEGHFAACSTSGRPITVTLEVPDGYWREIGQFFRDGVGVGVSNVLSSQAIPLSYPDQTTFLDELTSTELTAVTAAVAPGTCFSVGLSMFPNVPFNYRVTY